MGMVVYSPLTFGATRILSLSLSLSLSLYIYIYIYIYISVIITQERFIGRTSVVEMLLAGGQYVLMENECSISPL